MNCGLLAMAEEVDVTYDRCPRPRVEKQGMPGPKRPPGLGVSRMNSQMKKKRIAALIQRDGNACWYCHEPFDKENPPTIDHVKPRSKGGTNNLSNLRLSCSPCNHEKDDKWEDDHCEA